jgi:predicted esterase
MTDPRDGSAGGAVTRREFVGTGAAALGALAAGSALAACGDSGTGPAGWTPEAVSDPRLTARPGAPALPPPSGTTALGLSEGRDGLLFVPESYSPEVAAPLLVVLHGAGGAAADWSSYAALAADRGIVVLAPDSRFSTWDIISIGYYSADVDFLDDALAHVFARVRVAPDRIALGGFSDGASYALSLGLSNGDLFARLVGHSAGFLAPGEPIVGRPDVWMSHGSADPVLSLAGARSIETELRADGYDVSFTEFEGGHTVPPSVAAAALDWVLAA